jgi:hypothetical protein
LTEPPNPLILFVTAYTAHKCIDPPSPDIPSGTVLPETLSLEPVLSVALAPAYTLLTGTTTVTAVVAAVKSQTSKLVPA